MAATLVYEKGARPGGTAAVDGPASAPTDGDLVAFDGITGALLKSATMTGTGDAVRATSPTLVTPNIGVATATKVNKITITPPATGATLTLAEGGTLVTAGAFSITFTATAATSLTLPTSGTLATVDKPVGASTAAAGSTTADAGVLPAATGLIYPTTAANGTTGVRIHANDKVTGRTLFIGNGVSNQILKVYPPSGGTINGAGADAAFSGASGKGVIISCLNSAANTWLAW